MKPRELLDQAWNKPKLQHRAPNVQHMLQRANRVSYWVSQMVLACHTPEDRLNMVNKMIDTAIVGNVYFLPIISLASSLTVE